MRAAEVSPSGENSLLQRAGVSWQNREGALGGRMRPFPYQKWFVSLLICAFVVAVAFRYVDVLIARRVYAILSSADTLATGFGSAVLLGIEAVITLALVMIRIVRGHLSPFRETTALACLTSICAYAIND